MTVAIGVWNFLKMGGWEKAIPREMYIHMSTMGCIVMRKTFLLSLLKYSKWTYIAAMYSPPV